MTGSKNHDSAAEPATSSTCEPRPTHSPDGARLSAIRP